MVYRTFEGWKARGRAVLKGEKAVGHLTDGTALFGKKQTTKVPKLVDRPQEPDTWYLGDEYDYH